MRYLTAKIASFGDIIAKDDRSTSVWAIANTVEGKTWDHPATAHGLWFIRNSQEIACYELMR